jgi:ribosomal protein S18 acetylase RimI-like enzyme
LWFDRVAFRDYLRTNPTDASEYAQLKRALAEKHRFDREAYTDGKEPFVRRILKLALAREDLSPALRWLVGNSRHAIRPFRDEDEEAVVRIWHRSGKAAYDFLPLWQSLTLDRATTVFREVIAGKCDLWVGTLDTRIVAFLAMNDSYIDRMYVDPDHWHEGWGTRLLDFAKSRSPQGLELHTHQENHRARQFYEKHGFKAVKFGISPPPESAPDVEYHWRATAP